MAYETYVDSGAAPVFQHPADGAQTSHSNELLKITNLVAAAVSVALVLGVGVWGYKLMMRDVTGIPVVRSADGEMRIRPDTPGGELAQHQGLAVNAVAADGSAEAPADRLILAPQPVELTQEDMPLDEQAVAIVQQAIADQRVVTEVPEDKDSVVIEAAQIAEAADSGSMETLVAALTDGVEPLDALQSDGPEQVIQVAAIGTDAATLQLVESLRNAPGIKTSLRPQLRPKRSQISVQRQQAQSAVDVAVAAALRTAPPAAAQDIDPATLDAGTRLAQLGAYDTAEMAKAEWDKAFGQFGDLMTGKARVVQKASSGGRTFYRLRAHGFTDLGDARRFCSALIAEGGDCIPVVTR